MGEMYTIPSMSVVNATIKRTPDYMRPSAMPIAVVWEGALRVDQCEAIIEDLEKVEPYRFPRCGAVTREAPKPLPKSLVPLENIGRLINETYWCYDVGLETTSWFQTYHQGGEYKPHTDGEISMTRKLTAVALLSDEYDYIGGELKMRHSPHYGVVTHTRGTVVVFQPWVMHEVTAVLQGKRQTVNMGFFGPPFR